MSSLANPVTSIRETLNSASHFCCGTLSSATATIELKQFGHSSVLGCNRLAELAGRSILLLTNDQLAAGLALIELDGVARRIVICPPDTHPDYLPLLVQRCEIDLVVSDYELPDHSCLTGLKLIRCGSTILPAEAVRGEDYRTEWILLSSGTTGVPKMILHTLASVLAPINHSAHPAAKLVWGTFYDTRRYGGLQILLRAVTGGGSLVLSSTTESIGEYLTRLGTCGVTHISGTPSHWRRALMSPAAHRITPSYIRLSGEIVDQGILDALHAFYPEAAIGHAFASTEAGVGFEVDDGLAGFPASLLEQQTAVDIQICHGSLRLRSDRTASRYLSSEDGVLRDAQGFVDTGDMVEQRANRYYFLGRKNGVINVGGLKVYPEEVEAVINRHPAVRMSVVRSKKSPITGSLVSADILLRESLQYGGRIDAIKSEISEICRQHLAPHKVPVILRQVQSVKVASTGKLVRFHA